MKKSLLLLLVLSMGRYAWANMPMPIVSPDLCQGKKISDACDNGKTCQLTCSGPFKEIPVGTNMPTSAIPCNDANAVVGTPCPFSQVDIGICKIVCEWVTVNADKQNNPDNPDVNPVEPNHADGTGGCSLRL